MGFKKAHFGVLLVHFLYVGCSDINSAPVGCFKYSAVKANYVSHDVETGDPKCINICAANYYKYV